MLFRSAFNDPAANYVAQRVSLISIYGRTDKIAAADMPKTWDDLLNPRFKGKLVMTNPSFTSLQLGVVAMLSKARGYMWNAPLLAFIPGFAIFLTVLLYNWLGDGLRDALDPANDRL